MVFYGMERHWCLLMTWQNQQVVFSTQIQSNDAKVIYTADGFFKSMEWDTLHWPSRSTAFTHFIYCRHVFKAKKAHNHIDWSQTPGNC